MPVYIPERKIKTRCKKCGRDYEYTVGGFGDNLSFPDLIKIKKNEESKKCPYCGSNGEDVIDEE